MVEGKESHGWVEESCKQTLIQGLFFMAPRLLPEAGGEQAGILRAFSRGLGRQRIDRAAPPLASCYVGRERLADQPARL